MSKKSKIEEMADAHSHSLREGGVDEWDYENQQSSAIGQANFSFKLGASAIIDLAREWSNKSCGTVTMCHQADVKPARDLMQDLESLKDEK